MTKPSPTVIGTFVLGAMALIAAGVLFFGGGALLAKRLHVASFFPGSVAGLSIGAPVTFRGVRVGEVTAMSIRIDPGTYSSIIQVDMDLIPDSVAVSGVNIVQDENMLVPALVQRGLTAKLVTQSIVTGLLAVDLDFRPGVEVTRSSDKSAAPEIPSVPSDLQMFTKKIEDVDLGAVVQSLQRTLASVEQILAAPELKQTIEELPALAMQLRKSLKTFDREAGALSGAAREAITEGASTLQKTLHSVQTLATTLNRETASTASAARGTLKRADTALGGAGTLLDPNGRAAIQAQRAVDDLAETAARLRDLAERADRDPSILIRGR